MPTRAAQELHHYFMVLSRCNDRLSCPYCNKSLLAKYFENHVLKEHNLNGKYHCVWCEKVSWRRGEKYKYKKHLISCFREFVKAKRFSQSSNTNHSNNETSPVASTSNIQQYFLLDLTHPLPEKDFFGHEMTHPDPMFDITLEEFLNTPTSPLPLEILPPLPIPFEDERLNLAASCVLLYLETQDTHDFFHVMVKLVVFESFVEAMNEDRDRSYTLSFSCWCDGGKYQEPAYRQHRHAIVMSPKDHFSKKVWPHIKLPSGKRAPKPNFRCKKLKRITSPLHLVNTIGYVSKQRSRCNFSFKTNAKRMKDNHFYLYQTLPKDFKLHLCLLWENGVLELLKQTKFQNVSVAELATGVLTRNRKGQWTQKIKDFYGHKRGLVVRVTRNYIPTQEITPHFLHLAKGQKLYFEKLPEELDQDTWLRKQVEGGNCFYDAVEENMWVPRPRDQKVLNFHKPMVDRNRELESRLAEFEKSNQEKDRNNESLQSKLDEMQLKIQQLTDQVIRYKDEEIARLKRENYKQKHKIERQKLEIERLNDLINSK